MVKARGHTLAELMVAISLIMLGLSLVMVNLHHQQGGAQGSMGLARQVVKELRSVRSRALTSGNPRAFCIPTAGGTTPCSQSYYIMSGHGLTAPRQVMNTSRDYPGSFLFVGKLSASGTSISSQIHPTRTRPPVTPPVPPFRVSQWMNPVVQDFVFAFNSDGKLATNDLPHDAQGNSYIVVSDGLAFTSGSVPSGTPTMGTSPPPYFDLTSANQPYVISISAAGSISLAQGFPQGATAAITSGAPCAPSLPPAPSVVKPTLNQAPVIVSMPVTPIGNPANSPFDTTVPPDGRVSVTLNAYDPDGEDLSYKFVATSLDGPDPGKFTYSSSSRSLAYAPGQSSGTAKVDWVPPATVQLGDRFKLNSTVVDESGQTISSVGTVTVDLQVSESGLVAFESQGQIYTMLGDGIRPTNITRSKWTVSNSWPDVSPDGKTVVFVSDRPLTYRDVANSVNRTLSVKRIWMMNVDGSEPVAISNVDGTSATSIAATKNSTDDCPAWSPDGTQVVFARTNGTTTKIQVMNADGTWAKKDLDDGTTPCWSRTSQPADKDILYRKSGTTPGIYQMTQAGAGSAKLVDGGSLPVWSPDGSRFLYFDAGGTLCEVKSDGSGVIVKYPGSMGRPTFNPAGTRFLSVSGSYPNRYQDDGIGVAASQTPFRSPGLPMFTGLLSWGIRY